MFRYSIFAKFLAIVLCALSLLSCVTGVVGIMAADENDIYTDDIDSIIEWELYSLGSDIAHDYCTLYASEHLGKCSEEVITVLRSEHFTNLFRSGWGLDLYQDGQLLASSEYPRENTIELHYNIQPTYLLDPEQHNMTEDDIPSYQDTLSIMVYDGREYRDVNLLYEDGPEYQVVFYINSHVLETIEFRLLHTLYSMRYYFIVMLVVGLLLFAVTLVYLCHAAGRSPQSAEVSPAALNRLPLDLYAVIIAAAEASIGYQVRDMLEACFDRDHTWPVILIIFLCAFVMALMVVAFLFALAAQTKTRDGFWWRKSAIGLVVGRIIIGLILVRIIRLVRATYGAITRSIRAVVGMLPLVWQCLAAILGVLLTAVLSLICFNNSYGFLRFLSMLFFVGSILAFFGMIAYWGYCMGHLLKGITIMAHGNLHYQIPTQRLYGKFEGFGTALNSMADVARIAVQRQLKSERMKTELITNVSHDIKTPLTSIINYVDLLQKPHDEAQGEQYLEVLSRQSHRLKKLIDDLMDLSKASTGNINVEMGYVDAVEAINQALGEFSDRLDRAALFPVFQRPDEPVVILADGKLLWRVMSNLLSNAVKYAMPGTRIYIDLVTSEGNAVLHMKNISRDQLNINADELLERFVRGDTARNTEGSGLGLNIAKNLVELQKGQIQLMVDGDLFKVTIIFPLAQE